MLFSQLLVVDLGWHVLGFLCFQQPSPSPIPANYQRLIDKILAGQFNLALTVFAVTAAGLITLKIQSVARNRGPYDVNQFRVYFTARDTNLSLSTLAEKLEKNFPNAFDPKLVKVTRPDLDEPNVILFTIKLYRTQPNKLFLGKEREDYVVLSHPRPGDAVFQARTAGISGASSPDWHFLAGTRSWRIAKATDCDQYGEPVPSSTSTFFLETAAFEEYSFWTYRWPVITRSDIRKIWQTFLCDALGQLEVAVAPVSCRKSGNRKAYKLGGESWKKIRWIKWTSLSKFPIWRREVSYTREKVASFKDEKYARRLFNLHPGLEKEYQKAV